MHADNFHWKFKVFPAWAYALEWWGAQFGMFWGSPKCVYSKVSARDRSGRVSEGLKSYSDFPKSVKTSPDWAGSVVSRRVNPLESQCERSWSLVNAPERSPFLATKKIIMQKYAYFGDWHQSFWILVTCGHALMGICTCWPQRHQTKKPLKDKASEEIFSILDSFLNDHLSYTDVSK
jgi:hypothetical protein